MGSLFTFLQHSWWALMIGLQINCVFCYCQFLTRNPRLRLGTRGNTRSIRKHPFFKTVEWEAMLQKRVKPPYKPQIIEVSTTGSVLIFCHKELSLKLDVKGECKSCMKHIFVIWWKLIWINGEYFAVFVALTPRADSFSAIRNCH
jgi:hypothetical protein